MKPAALKNSTAICFSENILTGKVVKYQRFCRYIVIILEFAYFFCRILSKKQTTTEFLKNFCGAYGFGSCLTFIIFINDCFLFDVCFSFAWVKSRMLLVIFLLARLIKQPISKLRILTFFLTTFLMTNKTWTRSKVLRS